MLLNASFGMITCFCYHLVLDCPRQVLFLVQWWNAWDSFWNQGPTASSAPPEKVFWGYFQAGLPTKFGHPGKFIANVITLTFCHGRKTSRNYRSLLLCRPCTAVRGSESSWSRTSPHLRPKDPWRSGCCRWKIWCFVASETKSLVPQWWVHCSL